MSDLPEPLQPTQPGRPESADVSISSHQLVYPFLIFLIFATPLFFLPLTPNFFEFNKMYLVFGGSLLVWGILLARGLMSKKITFYYSPLDIPVILVLTSLIVSTLFVSSNKVLPFLGKTGLVLTLSLFYFALTQSKSKNLRLWAQALMASSFCLSWISIFAYVQVLSKVLPWDFVQQQVFNPAGSLTTFVTFQLILLPIIVIFAIKSNQFLSKILYFLVAALSLVSTVLAISLMLPGKPASPTFLPYPIGWWIAVEIFKEAKSALLGMGPEGFLTAFSRFRPVAFNNLDFWNLRFTTSSNELLQVLTTTGLFGLLTLIYLLATVGKNLFTNLKKDDFNFGLKITFVLLVLSFLVLPANFLSLFVFYIILASVAAQLADKKVFVIRQPTKVAYVFPFFIFAIFGHPLKVALAVLLVIILNIGYFGSRAWVAEATFKKALEAAAANKGLETYNRQIEAIKLNPFQEKYRLSYSQVNLALANSLAAKEDLSDQDRQNITQLVSQSIAEAKATVARDPNNPIYWENLASIYRALINFANGADSWAINSYIQAVRLDPVNPGLRIDLGGLFYALGNYESAIDQFKRAIDLKPDYPNAYYNLAWAYRQRGENRQAFLSMQRVIGLVPQETDDFVKATQELEELRQLLPKEERLATAAAAKKEPVLTPPPGLPSPRPAGPIKLPEEAGPEIPSEEATPSATRPPEASPKASPKP